MGMKIYFKIRKIEQILLNFLQIARKTQNNHILGYYFFRIFFKKMTESSPNNVGMQKS